MPKDIPYIDDKTQIVGLERLEHKFELQILPGIVRCIA